MLGIKDGPTEKKAMVIDMKINIMRESRDEMDKKIMGQICSMVI